MGLAIALTAAFAIMSGLLILAAVITVAVANWRRTQREIAARHDQTLGRHP